MITADLNYIPLAKAMPEYSKRDGKPYVCTLGYDTNKGFIRVYPAPFNGIFPWVPIRFKAEKNKRDPRPASWKMPEDCRHAEWSIRYDKVAYGSPLNESAKMTIVRSMMNNVSNSISELNEARASIGFLIVDWYRIRDRPNEKYINTEQLNMFDLDVCLPDHAKFTKESRKNLFYVNFIDKDGPHTLALNRWDIYETERKVGPSEAMRRFQKKGPHILMLGNLLQHQSIWSVLGIWSVPQQLSMFDA